MVPCGRYVGMHPAAAARVPLLTEARDGCCRDRLLGGGWDVARIPAGVTGLLDAGREPGGPQGPPPRTLPRRHQRRDPGNSQGGGVYRLVKRVDLIRL